GFTAPATWPKELTQKWKIPVGEGVATPALVGDKLYVFSWVGVKKEGEKKEEGKEILRCLDAETGQELWKNEYEAARASGPASSFAGARSSPCVTEGKVVTVGVQGTLSCVNASNGEKIWRNVDGLSHPGFFTSSSPIVVDGLCIAQTGGEKTGGIAAYNLSDGKEKWKWNEDSTAYASPVLMTVEGTKMIVAETNQNIMGTAVADGKLLWKVPFPNMKGGGGGKGGGKSYNASTPIVDGQNVIFSGANRGTRTIKIEKKGDVFEPKEVWSNKDNSVLYNTPIVHNSLVFGLTSNNDLFCINAEGKTAWTSSIKGKQGYGSIVDAGSVLLSLTPAGQLVVYEPNDKEFKEIALYKVSSTETYAYPVVSGKRIYVKDKDSVIMFTIE
ncbi:MAG TPA: PQQ-binding-like beta-propeller repeat protein, partial [Gemmata sp.]|nr:PQQ-binding-like beta-propeller repeat protein [Gemmata sp.]